MNKIAKSICMIAVVALAFTSCKKNENDDTKSFAFKGSMEQFVEVNENGAFERMYIDEGLNTFFDEGDRFGVYCITDGEAGSSNGIYKLEDGYLKPYHSFSNVTSTFTSNGHYYAFYPAYASTIPVLGEEPIIGFDPETNMGTFELNATQTYREPRTVNGVQVAQMPETAVYMAAKDETHKTLNQCFFPFRNIMGALSLKLYSPEGKTVTSIAVEDNHFNLVGTVHLRVDMVDPVEMTTLFGMYDESNSDYMINQLGAYLGPDQLNYSLDGAISNTVVLDCGEGVELGATAAEATRFLIVLRPLALMDGCKITVTFDDTTTKELTSTKDLRIKPNEIKNINPINVD